MREYFTDYVLHVVLLISFLEAEGGEFSWDGAYDLRFMGLTDVPDDIPQTADYVSLVGNEISRLRQNDFYHLKYCVILNLRFNRISVINKDAFNGLEQLEGLKLDFNKLKVLGPGMFTGLWSLQSLSLKDNNINNIADDTFSGLGKLRNLNLNSNQLTILYRKMFAGLWSLESLMLKHNYIIIVSEDSFDDLIPLMLDLTDNPINCGAQWYCRLWTETSITWSSKSSPPCFVLKCNKYEAERDVIKKAAVICMIMFCAVIFTYYLTRKPKPCSKSLLDQSPLIELRNLQRENTESVSETSAMLETRLIPKQHVLILPNLVFLNLVLIHQKYNIQQCLLILQTP